MKEGYEYQKLKDAGKASRAALEHSKSIVKSGRKLIDIATELEGFIEEKGFKQSFPVNLSANVQAAHYTPEYSDMHVVGDNDVIKVDLGARSGNYLTDCAVTICLDERYGKLAEAAESALADAISLVKAGRHVNEIGRAIAKVADSYGFTPIRNLGGHGIEQDELHARIFIPNFDNGDRTELEDGEVVAIEPFMTTGKGYVTDGTHLQIFQLSKGRMPRSTDARELILYIGGNFGTFPFATRWLIKGLGWDDFRVRRAIAELIQSDNLEPFPVLVEKTNGIVAQAEKTVIVEKDSCTIVT